MENSYFIKSDYVHRTEYEYFEDEGPDRFENVIETLNQKKFNIYIVGKGQQGNAWKKKLNNLNPEQINSSEAKACADSTFLVAGSPQDEIIKSLKAAGIKEEQILIAPTINAEIIIYQEAVYAWAEESALAHKVKNIIDIGSGTGYKLSKLKDKFNLAAVDFGVNLETLSKFYPFINCIENNIDEYDQTKVIAEIEKIFKLEESFIICADVVEHLLAPEKLLNFIRLLLNKGVKGCMISTPERDLVTGNNFAGPPRNLCHIREWNQEEFRNFLNFSGFNIIEERILPCAGAESEKHTQSFLIKSN